MISNGQKKTTIYINETLEELLPKYSAIFGGQSKAITECLRAVDDLVRLKPEVLPDKFKQ